MALRQILFVRHGETAGESSIRYLGSTDVDLSEDGRAQMHGLAPRFAARRVDLWIASNLRRSWAATAVVSRGARVRIEPDLREVHFGEWEGLTREEIEARDPALFADWQAGKEGFEYPGGEARASFQARIAGVVERLLAGPDRFVAGVLHKGVIREIASQLTGEAMAPDEPALAGEVVLTRVAGGPWVRGLRSSDPPELAATA